MRMAPRYRDGSRFHLNVINPKALVRNEQHRDVALRAGAMFHHFSFRKPHKAPRAKTTLVGDQGPLENIHPVPAWVRMLGVDGAGRIPHQTNFRTSAGIRVKVLAEERLAD